MRRKRLTAGLAALLMAGQLVACGSAGRVMNSHEELGSAVDSAEFGAVRLPGLAADGNASDESAASDDERIVAAEAVTIALDSGRLIFSHSAKESVSEAPFASLAALLTAADLLGTQAPEMTATVTEEMLSGTEEASCVGLQIGDVISVPELMYGTVIGGFADTAQTLALACGRDSTSFLEEMNRLAGMIGMEQTNYVDVYKMADGQTVSAYDLALLYREAVNRDFFLQISGESWHELRWQRADGSDVSHGVTSESASYEDTLEGETGCTVVSGLFARNGDGVCSWALCYRTAAGAYRISVLLGLPDEGQLIEQMKILLSY